MLRVSVALSRISPLAGCWRSPRAYSSNVSASPFSMSFRNAAEIGPRAGDAMAGARTASRIASRLRWAPILGARSSRSQECEPDHTGASRRADRLIARSTWTRTSDCPAFRGGFFLINVNSFTFASAPAAVTSSAGECQGPWMRKSKTARKLKTAAELGDMIVKRVGLEGIFLAVRSDPYAGWRLT